MSSAGTETALYEQFMQWVGLAHHELLPYIHFDLSGVWTPSHKARNLYGRLNRRSWPDMTLAYPVLMPGTTNAYTGMFLEFKREGTRLKKRDGSWASDHIREQARTLDMLAERGYVAQFVVGLDEAMQTFCSYINCTKHVPSPDGVNLVETF